MEWPLTLLLLFGGIFFLLCLGIPVAFSFLIITIVGAPLLWGLEGGTSLIILSLADSLVNFNLLPIPLFVFMGEIIFQSRIAPQIIDSLDRWIGRIPGRLSLMAIASGILFSTLTGTSIASTAMLGGTLIPEMEKKGYSKSMSIGPILGSGGLALMIPPSSLAVLLGAVAEVSIGKLLMAIIVPGVLMAVLFGLYIIIRCMIQPELAPPYALTRISLKDKILPTLKYVLPIGFIIFSVVGVIYLGLATPTEASATGALACLLFTIYLRKFSWAVLKKSLQGTIHISVMILFIVAASELFSKILAYTGTAYGLADFALGFETSTIVIVIIMQCIIFLMGMFLNAQAIIMICVPIFMPVIAALELNPVWFLVIFLLNLEMGTMSPPFGLALFVMKGVAPRGTTMKDVVAGALPFLALDVLVMAILIAFPGLVLWLGGSM